MKRILFAVAGLLLPFAITAAPAQAQAARNYDCTKAGNANKTVCKNAAAAAAKPAAKPAATRNYDCSKAGNANKAVCKGAASTVAATRAAPAAPATRHYDCSKAGNANKTACKGTTSAPMAPAPRAAPPPRTAPMAPASHSSTPTGQNTHPGGPNGATAKCRDGTLSSSAHRSGTCSRHGGVAQWY